MYLFRKYSSFIINLILNLSQLGRNYGLIKLYYYRLSQIHHSDATFQILRNQECTDTSHIQCSTTV